MNPQKASEAALFPKKYDDRLAILDEIHRMLKVIQTLRWLIEQGRRRNSRARRLLIHPEGLTV